jgi:hypothetical protein
MTSNFGLKARPSKAPLAKTILLLLIVVLEFLDIFFCPYECLKLKIPKLKILLTFRRVSPRPVAAVLPRLSRLHLLLVQPRAERLGDERRERGLDAPVGERRGGPGSGTSTAVLLLMARHHRRRRRRYALVHVARRVAAGEVPLLTMLLLLSRGTPPAGRARARAAPTAAIAYVDVNIYIFKKKKKKRLKNRDTFT